MYNSSNGPKSALDLLRDRVSDLYNAQAIRLSALELVNQSQATQLVQQAIQLASQATTIASNAAAVSSNTNQIGNLNTAVSGYGTRIGTLETTVGTLDGVVSGLGTRVRTLETGLGTANGRIGTNATYIANNLSSINGLSGSVSTINQTLQTNASTSAANGRDITTQGTRITALETRATTLRTMVDNHRLYATSTRSSLSTAESTISTQGSLININTNVIAGNGSRISTVSTSVGNLTSIVNSTKTLADRVLLASENNGQTIFDNRTIFDNSMSALSLTMTDFNSRSNTNAQEIASLVSYRAVTAQEISNLDVHGRNMAATVLFISKKIFDTDTGIIDRMEGIVDGVNNFRFFVYTTFMNVYGQHVELTERNNKEITRYLQRKWQHLDDPQLENRNHPRQSFTNISHTKHLEHTNILANVSFRLILYDTTDQDFTFKIYLNRALQYEEVGPATTKRITGVAGNEYEIMVDFRTTTMPAMKQLNNSFTLQISNKFNANAKLDSVNWILQEFV